MASNFQLPVRSGVQETDYDLLGFVL
jgi:hypothetical protein